MVPNPTAPPHLHMMMPHQITHTELCGNEYQEDSAAVLTPPCVVCESTDSIGQCYTCRQRICGTRTCSGTHGGHRYCATHLRAAEETQRAAEAEREAQAAKRRAAEARRQEAEAEKRRPEMERQAKIQRLEEELATQRRRAQGAVPGPVFTGGRVIGFVVIVWLLLLLEGYVGAAIYDGEDPSGLVIALVLIFPPVLALLVIWLAGSAERRDAKQMRAGAEREIDRIELELDRIRKR